MLPESPFPFNIIMGAGKQEAEHMGVRAKGEMLPKGERYDRPGANTPNLVRSEWTAVQKSLGGP